MPGNKMQLGIKMFPEQHTPCDKPEMCEWLCCVVVDGILGKGTTMVTIVNDGYHSITLVGTDTMLDGLNKTLVFRLDIVFGLVKEISKIIWNCPIVNCLCPTNILEL